MSRRARSASAGSSRTSAQCPAVRTARRSTPTVTCGRRNSTAAASFATRPTAPWIASSGCRSRKPTSCGFGGPGYRQLYVTTATRGLSDDDLARRAAGRAYARARRRCRGAPADPVRADGATRKGQAMSEAASRTFDGYRRADGRVGVRNHVLVLSPTGLTSAAAARVSSLVRGTICVTSGYGRGQVAADAKLQFDTLTGLACHPNVAATLVLSAGPDITQVVRRCDRRDRATGGRLFAARTCTKTRWRSSMPACAPRRGWFATPRTCAGKPARSANCASPSNADTPTRRRVSSAIRSPVA